MRISPDDLRALAIPKAVSLRQVIVFTHDDRRPESRRRQGITATFLEVTRRDRLLAEYSFAGISQPIGVYDGQPQWTRKGRQVG